MKGAQVFASYTKQAIVDYAGNPLIEALPPIFRRGSSPTDFEFSPSC